MLHLYSFGFVHIAGLFLQGCLKFRLIHFAINLHQTRSNKNDFGEVEMRDWWVEKDYIGFIAEKPIYADESLDDVAEKITVEVNLK